MCQVCIAFMTDWLRLPLTLNEPEYVKWTAVKRNSIKLATLFYETLSRLKESDRIIIHTEFDLYDVCDDTHAGTQLLRLMETVPNELSGLFAFIEDNVSINAPLNRLWLGLWLLRFWTTVFRLHKEHTYEINPSDCGSPPGMTLKSSTFRRTFMDSMAIPLSKYAEYFSFYD
jgi:hypothetical protein